MMGQHELVEHDAVVSQLLDGQDGALIGSGILHMKAVKRARGIGPVRMELQVIAKNALDCVSWCCFHDLTDVNIARPSAV